MPTDIRGTIISRGGVVPASMENKSRKGDYSPDLLPQTFHSGQDSSNMMSELSVPHDSGMVSETTSSTFQSMLASRDDSSLQTNQALQSHYPIMDAEHGHLGQGGASSKSLSHPNLSAISPRLAPRAVHTHSQVPPIPFPANLGGFTLSSMVGHFTSPHPQLQPQSLSMNPATGGLMQGLGLSVGSNHAQPPTSVSTLSNPPQPMPTGLLSNPPISIVNPLLPRPNLPPSTSLPMPLTHPIPTIPTNLQNPSVPLIPGMPNMYSYPYAATLPATSSANAHVGFPPQSLMPPGYAQYLPPSLYGDSPQQPPVSSANFSR